MKAKKENKVYVINTEQEKERYLKEGFDIYDDDGEVVAYSPLKKIAYSEYVKAAKEIERLQGVVTERCTEIEALKTEITGLKATKQEQKAPGKKAGE